MMDYISRQAVIKALDEIANEVADGYGYQYEKWRAHFAEMPAADICEDRRGECIFCSYYEDDDYE